MSVLSLVPATQGSGKSSCVRHTARQPRSGLPRALDVELAVQHVGAEVGERLVNHVLPCTGE